MPTQLSGILLLTFRELWAKKTILGLFVISTLVWVLLAFTLPEEPTAPPGSGLEQFPPDLMQRQMVLLREVAVAGVAYWGGTLLALFAAAPLFAGLLERGRIELLLSKPVSRTRLLGGHILGVLLMMLCLAVYFLGAVWLTLSLQTGVWNTRFLLVLPVLLAMFAVMYAIVVLMRTWTESTALALITAYGLIFLSILLAQYGSIAPVLSPFWRTLFDVAYHVLPNFGEVSDTVARLAGDDEVTSWYPFVSSLLFGTVCYAAALFAFNRKDF